MRRLSVGRLIAVTILGFALTLVSNTLEPAVFSRKVLELAPDRPNTALGFATFAGLIVAVLVQPIVGVYSDRVRSRWGQRLPFLAVGTLMVIVCLYLIASAPSFGVLVVGILLIQLSSNTVQGPWQALIPDLVPESQRGQASGIKALFDILALVLGRQAAGRLVGLYPQLGQGAILAAVTAPAVVFLLALAATARWARARPAEDAESQPAAPDLAAPSAAAPSTAAPPLTAREALGRTFRVDWRAHPAFAWWFANRALFWGAFIAINTFLVFYLMDVVGMPEAAAQRFVGNLTLFLGGALVVVSLPSGWLADRVGRKPLVIASGLVATVGAGLLLLARETTGLTVAGVVVGLGVGTFISANWALVTDIVPRGEAARYLGIANIATAGGSGLARLMGGVLIDPLNALLGSRSAGYLVVYSLAAAFFLASALVALRLPGHAARSAGKEGAA